MWNFVGLLSASVLFEGLPSASVHSDLPWWLLRLQSCKVAIIHWNQDWLVLAFAIDFKNCWSQQLGDGSLCQYLADPQKIPALNYCGIAHKFEYLSKSVILLGSSASSFGSLYPTRVFFDERLFGSSASKSICLVGLWIGVQLGSFCGFLISYCNQIKWMTPTWFPATKLRAFACVCVCVSWSLVKGVQVVKHAILIANSCPCWHPFQTLGLSGTTLWDPRGWLPRGLAQRGSNEAQYLGYWTPWPQLGGCSTA